MTRRSPHVAPIHVRKQADAAETAAPTSASGTPDPERPQP